MTKDTTPDEAQTTDTTSATVTELDAPAPDVLGEPGADEPDASEPRLNESTDPAGEDDPELDELLDLVDERLGYEVDRPAAVVEWLSRRGVRLGLAQRRKLGLPR